MIVQIPLLPWKRQSVVKSSFSAPSQKVWEISSLLQCRLFIFSCERSRISFAEQTRSIFVITEGVDGVVKIDKNISSIITGVFNNWLGLPKFQYCVAICSDLQENPSTGEERDGDYHREELKWDRWWKISFETNSLGPKKKLERNDRHLLKNNCKTKTAWWW